MSKPNIKPSAPPCPVVIVESRYEASMLLPQKVNVEMDVVDAALFDEKFSEWKAEHGDATPEISADDAYKWGIVLTFCYEELVDPEGLME